MVSVARVFPGHRVSAPPEERDGVSVPSLNFSAKFGTMGLSDEKVSAFSLRFFHPSPAAEWVCLIPSKISGHPAFRLGRQKQYEGKRRI